MVDITIPKDYEIMYITGESGSGKSTILKEIAKTEEISIPKTPLFEWGEGQNETLRILSLVGLGDAVLFLATYETLSDSQKARARIALELLSSKKEIIIDEFLSTLDRKTAQAVSYCVQKAIRKMGKKAIFVTAHEDLEDYLNPDVVVKGKAFPSRWEIVKRDAKNFDNPILKDCEFEYTDKFFYRELRLGELHYKGKYTGGVKEYLSINLKGECIGILVSTYRMHDGGRRISRVVIHPSYRGCGLGVSLVKRYLKDYPGADVVAAMAMFNPVFEKVGMTRVDDVKIRPPAGLKKDLESVGFLSNSWHSKKYCDKFMGIPENREILSRYAKNSGHLVCPGGKYLEEEEIKEKIAEEHTTASRVLWGLRPRTMAKYIDVEEV